MSQTRKLFVGPEATHSILEVSKIVDTQFIAIANKTWNADWSNFQSWMSLPLSLQKWATPPDIDATKLVPDQIVVHKIRNLFSSPDGKEQTMPSVDPLPIHLIELSEKDHETFRCRINEALNALDETLPWAADLFKRMVIHVLPVEGINEETKVDYGMSAMWLRRTVFLEKRQSALLSDRMMNLAHELAHQIVMNYQFGDRLIVGNLNRPLYSAIRRTNRPAIMALHGAAALSYMLIVSQTLADSGKLDAKARTPDSLRKDLSDTLKALRECELTPFGTLLIKEMNGLI